MLFNEYHVDGVRVDASYAIRSNDTGDDPNGWSVLKDCINDIAHSQPSTKLTIAEDGADLESITDPAGAQFDAQYGINDSHTIRSQVTAGKDSDVSVGALYQALANQYGNDAYNRVVQIEDHDMVSQLGRVVSQVGGWDAGGPRQEEADPRRSASRLRPRHPAALHGTVHGAARRLRR